MIKLTQIDQVPKHSFVLVFNVCINFIVIQWKKILMILLLSYNKLGYNKLGYNKLGYNKLGYNKLGYNKLSIIMKKKIIGFVHYNREKLLVKLREQTNHFFCS